MSIKMNLDNILKKEKVSENIMKESIRKGRNLINNFESSSFVET
jgi:hypothetical protein